MQLEHAIEESHHSSPSEVVSVIRQHTVTEAEAEQLRSDMSDIKAKYKKMRAEMLEAKKEAKAMSELKTKAEQELYRLQRATTGRVPEMANRMIQTLNPNNATACIQVGRSMISRNSSSRTVSQGSSNDRMVDSILESTSRKVEQVNRLSEKLDKGLENMK